MCFQYPGPRCSYHAHKEYLTALSSYERATDAENKIRLGEILETKKETYYSTPRGQNFLRREADASKDLVRENWLLLLKTAEQTRANQLAAYHNATERKDSSWREEIIERGKKLSKYGNATGIVCVHLLDSFPELKFTAIKDDTIHVEHFGKILVLPPKYQHQCATAVLSDDNKYRVTNMVSSVGVNIVDTTGEESFKELTEVVNDTHNTRDLREDQVKVFSKWWVNQLTNDGYVAVATVNLLTQDVVLMSLEDLFKVYTVRLKKNKRLGGTTAYTGSVENVVTILKDSPFKDGQVVFSEKLKKTLVLNVTPLAEKFKHQQDLYLGYRKTGSEEYYEVRKKHLSNNYDINVLLKLERFIIKNVFDSGIRKKLVEAEQLMSASTS